MWWLSRRPLPLCFIHCEGERWDVCSEMWVTGKTSASLLSASPSAASSQPITAATYSGGGWPQSSRLRPETHQETELQSEVAVPLFVKSQTHQRNDIYISLHISDTNWHSLKSDHTIRPDSHTHTHTHTHRAEAEPPNPFTVGGLRSSSVGLLDVGGRGEPEGGSWWSHSAGRGEGKWRRPCGSSHTSRSRAETEVRNSTFLRHLL